MSASSLVPGPSRKRVGDAKEDKRPIKIAKLHPLFSNFSTTPKAADDSSSQSTTPAPFHWNAPLGPKQTCLHGTNLSPPSQTQVAAFDLDGTIIKSDFQSGPTQWEWWRTSIPSQLKEVHNAGYSIVIVSNQLQQGKGVRLENWKKKMPLIAAALPEVPFRIFGSTARDQYRKPLPGIWFELEQIFRNDGVEIDKSSSFFVGDAAGRSRDFSSTDRKWASNIGIPFYTPEEYFLRIPSVPYAMPGFNVSSLPDLPPPPTPTPATSTPEIVLFVGLPCSGKTTFFHRHFEPSGYLHVNQDTLKRRDKCVKTVEEALQDGKSCVVDNSNRDAKTRECYVDLARKYKVPIRCFLFTASIELAWHNNMYRALYLSPSAAATQPKRDLLPWVAFETYRSRYEEPKQTEGFTELNRVDFVFDGTEEERRYWEMWLQIEGK